MSKTRDKTTVLTVRVKESTYRKLQTHANKIGMNVSELTREYIQKGMNIASYKEDIDFIRKQIREELQIQLKPSIERLAKLSVKTGIVSAAGYHLAAAMLSEFVHPTRQREYSEVLAESKKHGVAYFKVSMNEMMEKF